MNVHDAAFEGAQEIALQHAHETGQHDQIYLGRLQGGHKRALGLFIQLGAEFARRNELGRESPLTCQRQNARAFHVARHERDVCGNFPGGDGVSDGGEV